MMNSRVSHFDWRVIVFPLLATLISVWVTGFEFGILNNIFHIPYVLDYPSYPVFADDDFYQTLGSFTSIVFPAIKFFGAPSESNIEAVFLVAHLLSRLFAFVGLFYLLAADRELSNDMLGLTLIAIALCPLATGISIVGGHGLFIGYFTQTEVTWGAIFVSMGAFLRGRLSVAALFAGLTFAINAFVGLWVFSGLAVAYVFSGYGFSLVRLFRAGIAYCLFAAPVLIWILLSLSGDESPDGFSYIEYIRSYYPDHFLIEAAGLEQRAKMALIALCLLLLPFQLKHTKVWLAYSAVLVLFFLVGMPLPYWFDHRLIFNLHFLRVDGLLQMYAVCLGIFWSVRLLREQRERRDDIVGACILVALLVAGEPAFLMLFAALFWTLTRERLFARFPRLSNSISLLYIPALIAVLLVLVAKRVLSESEIWTYLEAIFAVVFLFLVMVRRHWQADFRKTLQSSSFLALGLVIVVSQIHLRKEASEAMSPLDSSWLEMRDWIATNGPHGEYLLPSNRTYQFQYLTQRRVWVDWKQGGAVMWAPAFYDKWFPRVKRLKAADSPEKFRDLASQLSVDYIVLENQSDCVSGRKALWQTESHLLCGTLNSSE